MFTSFGPNNVWYQRLSRARHRQVANELGCVSRVPGNVPTSLYNSKETYLATLMLSNMMVPSAPGGTWY